MLTPQYVSQIMYTFAKHIQTSFIHIYVYVDVYNIIFQL